MVFGQKMVKIFIVQLFWLKFDDVTVMLYLIVLSWTFLQTYHDAILLQFVKI